MNFIPLNVFSNFALLQSALTLDDYFKTLKKTNTKAAGISDPNYLFAFPHFQKEALKNEVKPLFGVRLVINFTTLVFYIKNRAGYSDLMALLEQYYHGEFKEQSLKQYTQNLITIVSTSNIANQSLSKTEYVTYFKKWALLSHDFYIGLEGENEEFIPFLRDFATKYNYQIVAFPLIKYIEPKDAKTLAMIEAIREGTTLNINETIIGKNYYLSADELSEFYEPEELENTLKISESIHFNFEEKRPLSLPNPFEGDPVENIRNITFKALEKIGKINNSIYLERLNYELGVIEKLGFVNYFLIVADYVAFAKSKGILVGYGRGSAPGSLVSYLLNITTVDPIEYVLLFERFLNPSRVTYPDIDIDFMDNRRGEVIDYIKQKYGEDHVSQIVTFQTNAAKASLRDAGRIYNIDTKFINLLSKSLGSSQYSLRDSYRKVEGFKKLIDTDEYNLKIVKEAIKLEGFPRQSGLHAAGLIIDKDPLVQHLPTFFNNDQRISQYEMGFLEAQGFLKVDILGLSNLTYIDNIIKSIKKDYGVDLDFYTLPFLDQKVYETIAKGLTIGLFQLESEGMRKAIKEIKPTSFDDVCNIIALYRPGPMQYIKEYAKRKHSGTPISYLNESFATILSPTYGIMIYQEQIMQIVQVMAGFSLAEADLLRRAISKKNEQIILKQKQAFMNGASKQGYQLKDSEKVFNDILKFADYGFNKSHSVVYTMTTLALAYLKTYYPYSFYQELLRGGLGDSKSFQMVLDEFAILKIKMVIPNVNKSTNDFVNDNGNIVFPLGSIIGLNNDTGAKIVALRAQKPFISVTDFFFRTYQVGLKEADYVALIESGALDSFNSNRSYLKQQLASYLPLLELSLFADEKALDAIIVNEVAEDLAARTSQEVARLRYPLSFNPLSLVKVDNAVTLSELLTHTSGSFRTYGVITSLRAFKTKAGEQMAFATLSNYETSLPLVIFPRDLVNIRKPIDLDKIYLVTGQLDLKDGDLQFIVSMLERYDHE